MVVVIGVGLMVVMTGVGRTVGVVGAGERRWAAGVGSDGAHPVRHRMRMAMAAIAWVAVRDWMLFQCRRGDRTPDLPFQPCRRDWFGPAAGRAQRSPGADRWWLHRR